MAEDLFWLLGPPLGLAATRDLTGLIRLVQPAAVLSGLEIKNNLFGRGGRRGGNPSFACFVKQDRDRRVRRKQIAHSISAAVKGHFRKWRPADPAAIEFWGFYIEEQLHLGLRLSTHALRYRGRPPAQRPAALRPTIAAALLQVAAPRQGETFVDPMCGSGAILHECRAHPTGLSLRGGDSDPEAVRMAQNALGDVEVTRWDARQPDLPAASVDCFVCNLPFGQEYSTPAANKKLYGELLQAWLPRLKAGGRLVLLTADTNALEPQLKSLKLSWRVAARVKVLGLWARIYRIDPA